ncbi:hypothetical protein JQX13_20530 [Archangium violaceum]|uniref:hypothetical protein n=1 Tax=Archangium violaceum TaxID=83451 RepID=UPI00193AF0CA|nr:hypothetical protein [Archangium violaceum]QRK12213.1 hypothetical protein JQX13_20530 [Archangium violaceum]
MLFPTRLNTLPGLLLAPLPLVAVGGAGLAFISFVGGRATVWRMVGAAGPYSLLMVVAVLGVMFMLSALLGRSPSGRQAPLVVLVGLATLPWLLGIAGTQEAMEKVLAALPDASGERALTALVAGTGEAMVTRLLGAWMSAALLVCVAVGLVLLRARAVRRGEGAGIPLGVALSLMLGSLALLVALEAHHLFELLTPLATRPPEAQAGLVTQGIEKLEWMQELRSASLVALAVLASALIGWRFFLRPETVRRWMGSLLLMALTAIILILDSRPMQLAAASVREAGVSRALLPGMVRPNLANARSVATRARPYSPVPVIRAEQ